MKYIQLKASLKEKLESAYLIFGEDRYLCFDALKKIEERTGIVIRDMNSVSISGDQATAKDIVDSANIYPFGDTYRLVTVKNFQSTDEDELQIIRDYLSAPLSTTILVFFCPDKPELFKKMKNIETVDCSKIDSKVIAGFVKNFLAKNDIASNDEAIDKLILYCGADMTRITGELEKLAAYTLDTKALTSEIVENFVVEDKDYQVYELSQFIANGDSEKAVDLVESFMVKSGAGFQILGPLYNSYRRALFISINKDKSNAELASMFGVKEFAVKMLESQTKVFSTKTLKQIVDMLYELDIKIKSGKVKENVAIKTAVFNILNLRGHNG